MNLQTRHTTGRCQTPSQNAAYVSVPADFGTERDALPAQLASHVVACYLAQDPLCDADADRNVCPFVRRRAGAGHGKGRSGGE